MAADIAVVRLANYNGRVLTSDQKGDIAETAVIHEAVKLGIGVLSPSTTDSATTSSSTLTGD